MDDQQLPLGNMGERLQRARRSAGLTRIELAHRLGVTRQTVRNYENGTNEPKVQTLAKWSMICGVSVEWLVFGDPSDPPRGRGPAGPTADR